MELRYYFFFLQRTIVWWLGLIVATSFPFTQSFAAPQFDTIYEKSFDKWTFALLRRANTEHYLCAAEANDGTHTIRFVSYKTKNDSFIEIFGNGQIANSNGVDDVDMLFLSSSGNSVIRVAWELGQQEMYTDLNAELYSKLIDAVKPDGELLVRGSTSDIALDFPLGGSDEALLSFSECIDLDDDGLKSFIASAQPDTTVDKCIDNDDITAMCKSWSYADDRYQQARGRDICVISTLSNYSKRKDEAVGIFTGKEGAWVEDIVVFFNPSSGSAVEYVEGKNYFVRGTVVEGPIYTNAFDNCWVQVQSDTVELDGF